MLAHAKKRGLKIFECPAVALFIIILRVLLLSAKADGIPDSNKIVNAHLCAHLKFLSVSPFRFHFVTARLAQADVAQKNTGILLFYILK